MVPSTNSLGATGKFREIGQGYGMVVAGKEPLSAHPIEWGVALEVALVAAHNAQVQIADVTLQPLGRPVPLGAKRAPENVNHVLR